MPAQEAVAFEGLRVVSVAFDPAQQPLDDRELSGILAVKPDQPYRAADVRAAIERLYATGRYQDIQVDVSPVAGGVAVRFITRHSWFIGNISTEQDFAEPPSAGQLVDAARLDLGAPFYPEQIPGAVESIRKLLVQNGFFTPRIEPRLDFDETSQQVAITFAITTGVRARYDEPQISGDTSVLSRRAVINATHWRRFLLPGYRGITLSRTRAGIDNIHLKYENANRLLATVTLDGIDQESEKRGRPRITANAGPEVTIKALGAKVSKKQLRQNVPVFEEHTVDTDLLTEGAGNLRDYFQAEGYFDVSVEFRQARVADGRTEIVYSIERGIQHRFVHLEITGNKYFDEKTIRERMFLVPNSFELRRGRYSEAFRRRDAETIKDLYASNGFRDARITSRTEDNYKGRTRDVAVFFTIEEGPQYYVAALDVRGPQKLDLTKALEAISSQTGQIFSEFNVATDRETIMRLYGENGFADATFEWNSKPGPRPNTVNLEFVIHEGEPQTVRRVITNGLKTTRPGLLNRQIDLSPGSPLSPAAMAETQRKLYDLGIFAQVDMAVQNPAGDEDRKNVVYNLEEARRYSITTGFGAEFARIGGSNAVADLSNPGGAPGFSPRFSFDATRLNFLGLGQTLGFQGRLSTLQKRGVIKYFVPRILFDHSLDASFSILYDDTHDVRTFESKRAEGSAQIVQRVSKPITVFYGFTYRKVSASNLKIDPLLLPRLAQSVRVGLASFNLVQDRRDDPLDAHRGIYNTVDVSLATKALGSQTSFVRLLGRNASYYKLGEKLVLARETQIGIQPAFSIPSSADLTDPIPLPERFFGGGGSTLRGFPENQAGPRDLKTGFPLGGSALFFNNTELRFPLYGANINGVLFEDFGNIFASLGDISFRVKQRVTQANVTDFSYMSHAAGFGLRYRTPIGPIRVDLAYSINPPRYYGFPGSYTQLVQCSALGSAAPGKCAAAEQHISHFQFFFSIGQAF